MRDHALRLLINLASMASPASLEAQRSPTTLVDPSIPPATIYHTERRVVGSSSADSLPRVLYVALPNHYTDSAAERYPVVYVLDGDGMFTIASGIERLLVLGREVPDMIIVGIGHGRPFLETVPFRWRNFTPTRIATQPTSGHAAELLAYLAREVVPLVDSLYRTVPGDRTLVGMSRSGLFVLYTLFEEQALFPRMIAASPEVAWDNNYLFRRDSSFAASKRMLPVTLYLSVGGAELARPHGVAVKEFADALSARRYDRLHVWTETLPSESHNSGMGVAITHGLKAVFHDTLLVRADSSRR